MCAGFPPSRNASASSSRSCRRIRRPRCAKRCPTPKLKDALFVLERLRVRKSPEELEKLRLASELVIDSMLAVIASHGAGATKAELSRSAAPRRNIARPDVRLLPDRRGHRASTARPPISAGRRAIRCPSIPAATIMAISATWRAWASSASPTPSLKICSPRSKPSQQAAFKPIRPGVNGGEIYAAADPVLKKSKLHNHYEFLAHGMGLVSHEAPRLTNSGPVPYDAYDAQRPLEIGHGDFGRDHAAASAPRLHQA